MRWSEVADILSGIDLGTVILWIIVASVILGGLRRVWPALRRLVELADDLGETREFRRDTRATLARFSRQLENSHPDDPNLREELTETRESVDEIKNDVKEVKTKLYADNDRLAALEKQMATLEQAVRKDEK